MKRIVLLFVFVLGIFTYSLAQKGKVASAQTLIQEGKLEKAKENLDEALQHEKSKDYPKTYFVYGRLCQSIYESKDESVKSLVEDPLFKAYEYYQQSIKMDDKDRMAKDFSLQAFTLRSDFISYGIEAFNNKKYEDAVKAWEIALEMDKLEVFAGAIDTAVIYNAGIAAYQAKDYDKALQYYDKAKEYGFGEANTYILIKNVYIAKEDSTNALETLQAGFEKYSDDYNILLELVNYYLLSTQEGASTKALEYLEMAKEKDPGNADIYFAIGTVHDKQGNFDEALQNYKKAVEADNKHFRAYYNLGALHFNKALELMDKANQIIDNKKFGEAKKLADDEFLKSVPYMEKAEEVKPDSKEVLETLKILYYRLKMNDKHEVIIKKIEALSAE